jgi:hypothetical protein
LEENPDLFFEVMAKLQPRVLQAANEQRLAVDMNYETSATHIVRWQILRGEKPADLPTVA